MSCCWFQIHWIGNGGEKSLTLLFSWIFRLTSLRTFWTVTRWYFSACNSFMTQLYPLPDSPSSGFTHTPGCPSVHIPFCFLIVFFLNSTLIIIAFGGKLFSYFCLQCQYLHYQSVTNCTHVTAVRLKCSISVTAGHQLLVSVLRMEEAERGMRLSILILSAWITEQWVNTTVQMSWKWVALFASLSSGHSWN